VLKHRTALTFLAFNNDINSFLSFALSRKEEANDGVLCDTAGDKDDQGQADVYPPTASRRRNCEEDVPEAVVVCLPGLRTNLQILRILSCGAYKVSPSPPSGERGHVFRLFS
jgi:hypothetical protein